MCGKTKTAPAEQERFLSRHLLLYWKAAVEHRRTTAAPAPSPAPARRAVAAWPAGRRYADKADGRSGGEGQGEAAGRGIDDGFPGIVDFRGGPLMAQFFRHSFLLRFILATVCVLYLMSNPPGWCPARREFPRRRQKPFCQWRRYSCCGWSTINLRSLMEAKLPGTAMFRAYFLYSVVYCGG